jgi:hypothetical protein
VVVDVTALSRMVRSCAAPAAEADGDGESSSTVETGNGSEAAADPDDVGSSNKRRHRCGRNNAAQQRSAGDLLRRCGTARSAPRRWFFPHTALPRRESDSGENPPTIIQGKPICRERCTAPCRGKQRSSKSPRSLMAAITQGGCRRYVRATPHPRQCRRGDAPVMTNRKKRMPKRSTAASG